MTGYQSKKAAAQAKLDDDDAQGYIAEYEAELQKEYQRGYEAGKAAQPAQELIVGTKTWFEDGKVITQHLTAKEVYKEPAQEPVASCNGMPAYEGPLSKALTQDLGAPLTINGVALYPQPQVRTGDCLLVGVCASEGHKIQAQHPWVDLTPQDYAEIFVTARNIDHAARLTAAKLKELNA
jgi:hypothetical protein